MKVFPIVLLFISFFLSACTSCNEATRVPGQVIETITTEESAEIIQNNQDNPGFYIIDVRTPAEYTEAHLENAINIDYYSSNFKQKIDEFNKESIYLIYCRSGNRSKQALNIFSDLGFKEVYDMEGGITKWIAEDRPVVS